MIDIQQKPSENKFPIQRVGIRQLLLPVYILEKNRGIQHTVTTASVYVDLDPNLKGIHMSRLQISMQRYGNDQLHQGMLKKLSDEIRQKSEAKTCQVRYKFPYFTTKTAPVSKEEGIVYNNVIFDYTSNEHTNDIFRISVGTSITSLCPCSKAISEHGAHNQRSEVKISCECIPKDSLELDDLLWIEDLIEYAEKGASCEIYSILKRPDEKYVTEKAYNNPCFVEDAVRTIYKYLVDDKRINRFVIEVENHESIHQHNAYAKMASDDEYFNLF